MTLLYPPPRDGGCIHYIKTFTRPRRTLRRSYKLHTYCLLITIRFWIHLRMLVYISFLFVCLSLLPYIGENWEFSKNFGNWKWTKSVKGRSHSTTHLCFEKRAFHSLLVIIVNNCTFYFNWGRYRRYSSDSTVYNFLTCFILNDVTEPVKEAEHTCEWISRQCFLM